MLDRCEAALAALALTAVALIFAAPALATEPPVTAAAESLRTSWYPDEPHLTPQLLEEEGGFAQNFEVPVQGQVYAQPLVSAGTLFVATEDNRVYGIDSETGEVRWERNVGTPWNSADLGCEDLAPHVGVTGTPVIDPSTNTAYFFAKGYETGEAGPAEWKMHAVDLATGEERAGFPVTIAGEAENLPVAFDPTHQLQRPALLLMNGVVYAGFGGHCDISPFHGWIVGVSTSGQIKTMWATTEAGHNGAAIWMGGGGIASDKEGQLLFATGNSWSPPKGPGSQPHEGHLGDSVVRAQIEPDGTLKPKDFFAPYNSEELDMQDLDLGSSAPLSLPSPYFGTESTPHLLVQVGKSGLAYLLNRDSLGGMKQGPEEKNADLGETQLQNGVWGSLATWPGDGGYVYVPASGEEPGNGALEVLKYEIGPLGVPKLSLVARAPGLEFGSGSPVVTSNGATAGSGIVWISHCPEAFKCEHSTLSAYAAVPSGPEPDPLWSAPIGTSNKFVRPLASEERIYVATRGGRVFAFGPTHHTLTIQREAAGGGSVSSTDEAIDCGSTCTHVYANGAPVTLTATPAEGFEFAGWSGGGCSGTGPCQVSMYVNRTVTASFIRPPAPGPGTPPPNPSPRPGQLPLPDTRIVGAKIDKEKGKATFRFEGTAETRSFQCKLIRPAVNGHRAKPRFVACASKTVFKHLAPGRYTLQVRALNATGADPTPAKRRFAI
ncbi:MAG: outer membrane protein assembly factor BamB family protein [Solirubrobacterales bacterium]